MLTHFCPWDSSSALVHTGETYKEPFERMQPSKFNRKVMANWEAMFECEDSREIERQKRKDRLHKESRSMTALTFDGPTLDIADMPSGSVSAKDLSLSRAMQVLADANFLNRDSHKFILNVCDVPKMTSEPMIHSSAKKWKNSLKRAVEEVHTRRNNLSGRPEVLMPVDSLDGGDANDTYAPDSSGFAFPIVNTVSTFESEKPLLLVLSDKADKKKVIDEITTKFTLNKQQTIVFGIIARTYIEFNMARNNSPDPEKYTSSHPLRLLLTGPGGTGKTHVASAQQYLMEQLGCGHRIRIIAPTASAAKTARGSTIHGGLFIRVKRSKRDKGGEEGTFFTVEVTNNQKLRDQWKDVDLVLIDEVSLIGLDLLAQIDHALRKAKEHDDLYFGGCGVILCGDLYQHPPVGGHAVYSRSENAKATTDYELLCRLGRLAWDSITDVIELVEQNRMKGDIKYAEAVNRFRLEKCNTDNVLLFNSRVVRGPLHPSGIDMGLPENVTASSIVHTNFIRQAINVSKARLHCAALGKDMVMCAARDVVDGSALIDSKKHESLLQLDVSSQGSSALL